MNFRRTGIILFTNHYEACVSFYSETLGLPVMFVADEPGYVDNVLSPSPGSDPALGVDPANNFDNSAFVG